MEQAGQAVTQHHQLLLEEQVEVPTLLLALEVEEVQDSSLALAEQAQVVQVALEEVVEELYNRAMEEEVDLEQQEEQEQLLAVAALLMAIPI